LETNIREVSRYPFALGIHHLVLNRVVNASFNIVPNYKQPVSRGIDVKPDISADFMQTAENAALGL
jgi:hypothetical protein